MPSVDDTVTLCGLAYTAGRWRWYIGSEQSQPYDARSLAMDGLAFAIRYRRERNELGRWGMGPDLVESGGDGE